MLENEQREKFCLHFVETGNATESAKFAGYSHSSARSQGQRLLTKADIKARIEELNEEMRSKKIADATEMQEVLTQIIRQELKEENIVVEGCGDGCSQATVVTKKSSHKDVIKAVETLARMQGVLNANQNVNITVPVVFGGENDLED